MSNESDRLKRIWEAVQNEETECAADEDCLNEANVFIRADPEEGDIYVCARHAAEMMDA